MIERDILARQRKSLCAFLTLAQRSTHELLEVNKRAEADTLQWTQGAEAAKSQTRAWIEEARGALVTGRKELERVGMTNVLEVRGMDIPLQANAFAELERTASEARQACAELVQSVDALWLVLHWAQVDRERRLQEARKWRRRIGILAVIALALCAVLVVAVTRSGEGRHPQQYGAALAALEAGDWDQAREGFSALGGYQDSATMVAEVYYREAVSALEAGEQETARGALQHIPGYRDADELLTTSTPTSTKVTPTREPLPTPTPTCGLSVDSELESAWARERLGCPTTSSSVVWAAWEPFERGRMLWRSDTTGVYVLYLQDGSTTNTGNWKVYCEDWPGTDPNGIGLSPPAGLLEPVRGFGWVWRTFLGGPDSEIGWAREEEQGICVKVQSFEKGFIFRSSQAQCSNEQNRASELPLILFALQGTEEGKWWRYER